MIYYIAGAGRSGTTLLDIVLGSFEGNFSLGELSFYVKNGLIDNEYCSCHKRVKSCEFWSRVTKEWEKERILSLKEYRKLQWKYLRNKATFLSLWNYYLPSNEYKYLIEDTKKLYEIIYKISGENNLIDSSKNAQYLLLLSKIGLPFKVVHITRSFQGVLSSTQKEIKQDVKNGVEKQNKPQTFSYSLKVWLLDNFLVVLFSNSKIRFRIKYEDFIENPFELLNKEFNLSKKDEILLKNRGKFNASHMVAGGRVRMKHNISIQKEESIKLSNLNFFQNLIVNTLEKIY